ncbi:CHAP domain-containing protein [Actinocrispum wychmicini]|uniref:CHAP domain-containing protein n=1 Tax=Actinocrispum wychmicini TaxID=1213861 RepID=A0A4V2S5J4_9PSEU|nr:CHAP domain-containing protein [Actinocrispum wychmicini]TCO52370.1 CHAP domain-containing protein [Actinocrispum wychmicini]
MRWLAVVSVVLLGLVTGGTAAATFGTDDYPYRAAAVDRGDAWGFLTRECTSFVAWRVHVDLGVTDFTNHYRGGHFGDARNWAANARRIGLRVDSTPTKGAVAVFPPGVAGAGGYGHVAIVLSSTQNTVTVEDYNFEDDWNNYRPYRYGQHTEPARSLSFVHF